MVQRTRIDPAEWTASAQQAKFDAHRAKIQELVTGSPNVTTGSFDGRSVYVVETPADYIPGRASEAVLDEGDYRVSIPKTNDLDPQTKLFRYFIDEAAGDLLSYETAVIDSNGTETVVERVTTVVFEVMETRGGP